MSSLSELFASVDLADITAGCVYGELAPSGTDICERGPLQLKHLRDEILPVMQSAESSRVYGEVDLLKAASALPGLRDYVALKGSALEIRAADATELFRFLSDSSRSIAKLRGDPLDFPPYDNLLCFFPSWQSVPLSWWQRATKHRYHITPFKGVSRTAKTHLKKYLQSAPEGCVVSISLTMFRTAMFLYPGAQAAAPLANVMADLSAGMDN